MNVVSPVMEWHQKNAGGNARIAETMMRYFRFPQGFENFIYLSQIQQALAIEDGRGMVALAEAALHGHALLAAQRHLAGRLVVEPRPWRRLEAAALYGAALLLAGRGLHRARQGDPARRAIVGGQRHAARTCRSRPNCASSRPAETAARSPRSKARSGRTPLDELGRVGLDEIGADAFLFLDWTRRRRPSAGRSHFSGLPYKAHRLQPPGLALDARTRGRVHPADAHRAEAGLPRGGRGERAAAASATTTSTCCPARRSPSPSRPTIRRQHSTSPQDFVAARPSFLVRIKEQLTMAHHGHSNFTARAIPSPGTTSCKTLGHDRLQGGRRLRRRLCRPGRLPQGARQERAGDDQRAFRDRPAGERFRQRRQDGRDARHQADRLPVHRARPAAVRRRRLAAPSASGSARSAPRRKKAGFDFAWHNHDFEFKPLADGSHAAEAASSTPRPTSAGRWTSPG